MRGTPTWRPLRQYAVFHDHRGWLVDTCAAGTWRADTDNALRFDSEDEARAACKAADIELGEDARIVGLW